jgi:TRAP-type C4-dicarboxylate transport system permease small subunit
MFELEERILLRMGRPLLRATRVMGGIAAIVLGIMMVNVTADVIGRKFFLLPIEGTPELVAMMLVIAASLTLGYCQLNKSNIRITLFFDLFPPRGQSILYLFAHLICAFVSGLICWQGWIRGWGYVFKGEAGETVVLGMPYWPFMLLLALGFGWTCCIFLIDIYLSIVEVFRHGTD